MNKINNYDFFHKLCRLSFVDEIWLFGSRARGDNSERSDIDLAILCNLNTSETDWQEIVKIITNADTLLKIDYIHFNKLENEEKIKENILKYKKVIYKKE